ncbi:MAG: hypothetical protein KZQ88_10565 [Candidatus Thiodiazotropha sp. (ex Dulcina madagascariensis)]|nr:hypothetical protein [Candidatus Thiodiazotropha sp. (ex Dulcina madagascariensis)]
MWNNLFITFELTDPEQNQSNVFKAIESLGNSTRLHTTCWYVNSPRSASEAAGHIGSVMSEEDILVVTDTSNDSATWHNLNEKQEVRIKQNWER